MPSNRRTRGIFVDERHRERVRTEARPRRDFRPQRQQKLRQRLGGRTIVGFAKERDASSRNHPTHFEVRESDMVQRDEQSALVHVGDGSPLDSGSPMGGPGPRDPAAR